MKQCINELREEKSRIFTGVVKSTIILQQNHLSVEVHYFFPDPNHLIFPVFGLCHSVLQFLYTKTHAHQSTTTVKCRLLLLVTIIICSKNQVVETRTSKPDNCWAVPTISSWRARAVQSQRHLQSSVPMGQLFHHSMMLISIYHYKRNYYGSCNYQINYFSPQKKKGVIKAKYIFTKFA